MPWLCMQPKRHSSQANFQDRNGPHLVPYRPEYACNTDGARRTGRAVVLDWSSSAWQTHCNHRKMKPLLGRTDSFGLRRSRLPSVRVQLLFSLASLGSTLSSAHLLNHSFRHLWEHTSALRDNRRKRIAETVRHSE